MSFFGFDPTKPPESQAGNKQGESYDFENTYDGLGDQLDGADDALNAETFGTSGDIGKDFNFGATKGPTSSAPPPPQTISYAKAAVTTNDEEFMSELWGTSKPSTSEPSTSQPAEKKILSLEEIEAQLTAIDPSRQQQAPMQQFPQPPFGMPPGMMPMQYGYMPPMYGGQYPGMPPQMMGQPGFYGQMPPLPGQVPPQINQPPQVAQQGQVRQPPQVPHQGQVPPPPQVPQQGPVAGKVPPQPENQGSQTGINAAQPVQTSQEPEPVAQNAPAQPTQPVQNPNAIQGEAVPLSEILQPSSREEIAQVALKKTGKPVNYSQFPVLGSKDQQQQFHQHRPNSKFPHHHQHYNQQDDEEEYHEPLILTPEQQIKAARRQEKVMRIMKYSGIMNPKDKDFVTRFQLSQIVTEDPYNEDFYAQVYKVIHPKANQLGQPQEQNNSIAQAYLDQSGHRLGGRFKRADVALQRMQQQVQRAVTVAKERPKLTQYVREGALGRISIGSGKKPRQQLEIFSQAVQKGLEEDEGENSTNDDTNKENKGINVRKLNNAISNPAINSNINDGSIKQYTKKDIMGTLENIITNLMTIESESRLSNDVDTNDLWESLKILEQTSPKVNNPSEVNPFIQCLNHEKALKIVSRLFKFLTREQILTIATLIMSNLENLDVIKHGSYTTYEDKKVSTKYNKLIETYSLTFTKALMNSVQDFKFNEIIGLLVILIEHNNVSFISTTKIGLSILTTLLSRAELIRGEGTISATDLSEWSSCYDELFTSLESRISLIFPPNDIESNESYVWQFLATLALGGKLNHQRIIVDEVRDEIFSVMNKAKSLDSSDINNFYKKQNLLNNLNMFLVVMGLVADENEIRELQT